MVASLSRHLAILVLAAVRVGLAEEFTDVPVFLEGKRVGGQR
jgi:hypothetical protein